MRNLSLLISAALVLSTLAGCGSNVETQPCGVAECSTGTGGSATTSTSSTGSNGTGGASTTSSTGVGGGTMCGGFKGAQCAPEEYCDYATNSCGIADDLGTCRPRSGAAGCPDLYSPTCACDGMVYGNPCEAGNAGFDVNENGGCKAPMGKFTCGSSFCELGTTYCRRSISDIGGEPSSYECAPLPPACGNKASCACLANVPCGSSCGDSGDGGIVVTCAGG
ncbi:MAG: hypothetical protein ABI134_25390 [Byssovorax sp.]